MHFFESEWQPDTEPGGALEPPRRRPPTAVATGKLPPRPPNDPDDMGGALEDDGEPYREPSMLRRIGLRLLAIQTTAAALLLLRPLGWRGYACVSIVLLAQFAWQRARSAPTVLQLPRGNGNGEPYLRSA